MHRWDGEDEERTIYEYVDKEIRTLALTGGLEASPE